MKLWLQLRHTLTGWR